jgi:hypothetical protein
MMHYNIVEQNIILPLQTLSMTTASLEYKHTGIQRILSYKSAFSPTSSKDDTTINSFVNLFCEYQLADNNYMNIHLEATMQKDIDAWFNTLSIDQVLQFITYIIWTDKFLPGYLFSKIKDNTIYRLLNRAEVICLS